MIDRIEFANIFVPEQALAVTFFYDTDCTDTFTVFDRNHVRMIMELTEQKPQPEEVLIMLRDLIQLTSH